MADESVTSVVGRQRTTPASLMATDTGLEPKRDWKLLGIITGHRARIACVMTLTTLALYFVQNWLWPHGVQPHGVIQNVYAWLDLLWCGAVLPGFFGFLGMISYRYPENLDTAREIQQLVVWRIVTRGTNISAVASTVNRCIDEMARNPLFDYLVEVVIEDVPLDQLPQNSHVHYLVIPNGYVTPRKSLYKARALYYASIYSKVPDDAWIVHLDEETQPTSSGIKGIAKMIAEEEASGELRIGQGAILYHRKWREHPWLTLADNVRTGDDFARFYFQHLLGKTIFGLHGSYIVVRNDIEKKAPFDFGPVGSITEDAFWALVLMQKGVRTRWCKGYLEEQSTESVKDFVKQRRRWYSGLKLVSLHAPVKLRWRICLGMNTALWTLAPFAGLYTFAHFAFGYEVNPVVRLLANLSFASFATLYLTGLKANLDEHGITNWFTRVFWTIAQLVLLWPFSLLESIGVVYGFKKPKGFDVVKK